ncbi:hypothetical protein FOA52_007740 [Chlamydomonas sp. UWO 241]|nr:hypothetical protein FOA52_007740 [Chlamydomonas sp. UWO 241]
MSAALDALMEMSGQGSGASSSGWGGVGGGDIDIVAAALEQHSLRGGWGAEQPLPQPQLLPQTAVVIGTSWGGGLPRPQQLPQSQPAYVGGSDLDDHAPDGPHLPQPYNPLRRPLQAQQQAAQQQQQQQVAQQQQAPDCTNQSASLSNELDEATKVVLAQLAAEDASWREAEAAAAGVLRPLPLIAPAMRDPPAGTASGAPSGAASPSVCSDSDGCGGGWDGEGWVPELDSRDFDRSSVQELAIYFPDYDIAELHSALDAFCGDVMAAVDMLLTCQEAEAAERAARAAADGELAQRLAADAAEAEAMRAGEDADAALVARLDALAEQAVRAKAQHAAADAALAARLAAEQDAAATQLEQGDAALAQRLHDEQEAARLAELAARQAEEAMDDRQLVSRRFPPGGAGSGGPPGLGMLQLSTVALEELDAQQCSSRPPLVGLGFGSRRGSASAHTPPLHSPTQTGGGGASYGQFGSPVDPDARALARRTAILRGLFGDCVPVKLLRDALANCGGGVGAARAALLAMGLSEVAPGAGGGGNDGCDFRGGGGGMGDASGVLGGVGVGVGGTGGRPPRAPPPTLVRGGVTDAAAQQREHVLQQLRSLVPYATPPLPPSRHASLSAPPATSADGASPIGGGGSGVAGMPLSSDDMQHLYQQHRSKAQQLIQLREEARRLAQEAYEAGDRKTANVLREHALALQPRIKQEHQAAADRLFTARNQHITNRWQSCGHAGMFMFARGKHSLLVPHPIRAAAAPSCAERPGRPARAARRRSAPPPSHHAQPSPSPEKVDLHALHVDEAIAKLQSHLTTMSQMVRDQGCMVVLSVITGRGKHSKDGDPKVLPAVREFLDTEGHPYSERVGCIDVELAPPADNGASGRGRSSSPSTGPRRSSMDGYASSSHGY